MSSDWSRREGRGIRWQMVTKTCMGESVTSGFTIDNLDSKSLKEASSSQEELFIRIRDILEKNESKCLDDTSDRLVVCQAVTDELWKHYKKGT